MRICTFGRKVKARPSTSYITRGLPDRIFTKLNYVDIQHYVANSSTINLGLQYQTSIYMPRTDGNGHQAYLFDQWMPQFYLGYRVFGIKYDISCTSCQSQRAFWLGVRLSHVNDPDTQLELAMEKKNNRWVRGSNSLGNKSNLRLTGYLSVSKLTGEKPMTVKTSDKFASRYDESPAHMCYIIPYVATADTTNSSFDLTIKLTYYVELFRRATSGSS